MAAYSLRRLLSNIKYLMQVNLREQELENRFETLLYAEDLCRYDVLDPDDQVRIPQILSPESSLSLLLESPKSFARFGDGEVALIKGESISFQEYDPRLADEMKNILRNECDDLYVGINYGYFHTSRHMNLFNRRFYMMNIRTPRQFLLEHCSLERPYIAAGFNQMYMCTDDADLEEYYNRIKSMFAGRDLVIFAGEGIFYKLEHDVFDQARSKEYVWGPSRNSFAQYDLLLKKARSYGKDKTLCFILGPTSKVLVYHLAREGYMAWDIGHMAKDYDFFCRKTEKTDDQIAEFYAAD